MWVVIPWRPTARIPRDLFGPMLRYGRGIVAVRMLTTLMLDLDVIVVGRFLGVTALGLYQMAARIPDSSVMVLIWVAAKTLFPAFARLHAEGADVRNAYLIATRCVSSLTIPASLGLFFLARPIILVFFGPQWGSAAVILSMLAIYVGLRAVDYDIGNVMKATGRTNTLVWLTAIKAVLLVPAVLIGATYSAAAVAGALAAVFGIGTLITTIVCARILDIRLRAIAAAFSRSGTAGAIMSVVLWLWLRWAASYGNVIQLAGGVAIGGAVYIIALRLLDPEIFDWLKKMVFARKTASADELLRGAA
jgi:lipopolysaccharide exporter